MRRIASALILICLLVTPVAARTLSDPEIRQRIIAESIASYPGPCACPYNIMRNGRMCGRRSAYSRPGGYAPLCYASDVSDAAVAAYRKTHGL